MVQTIAIPMLDSRMHIKCTRLNSRRRNERMRTSCVPAMLRARFTSIVRQLTTTTTTTNGHKNTFTLAHRNGNAIWTVRATFRCIHNAFVLMQIECFPITQHTYFEFRIFFTTNVCMGGGGGENIGTIWVVSQRISERLPCQHGYCNNCSSVTRLRIKTRWKIPRCRCRHKSPAMCFAPCVR